MNITANKEIIYIKNPQARLILVLGLPASGKTTICETYFGDNNKRAHFIDDALFHADVEIQLADLLVMILDFVI